MPPMRLTASQWIEKFRLGAAVMLDGQRHIVERSETTAEPDYLSVEVEEPDERCAFVDGRLDAEDLARVLTGFRGQPLPLTPSMRFARSSSDGDGSAYVFDVKTGMVFILD